MRGILLSYLQMGKLRHKVKWLAQSWCLIIGRSRLWNPQVSGVRLHAVNYCTVLPFLGTEIRCERIKNRRVLLKIHEAIMSLEGWRWHSPTRGNYSGLGATSSGLGRKGSWLSLKLYKRLSSWSIGGEGFMVVNSLEGKMAWLILRRAGQGVLGHETLQILWEGTGLLKAGGVGLKFLWTGFQKGTLEVWETWGHSHYFFINFILK